MTLSWFSIIRLGLVQMALGALVVLMTSTLNRLMTVELALPAILPGFLVALHYGIQITRPNWGFRGDTGRGRARFILGGMAALAAGAWLAAYAVTLMDGAFGPAFALSVFAYALIGLGVGASGTSLLALLAGATAPRRRAAAATITWLMMIFGIALTAGGVGAALDPYSEARLLIVVGGVALFAVALTALAIFGVESGLALRPEPEKQPFLEALAEEWAEPRARRFTMFVFLSMTAFFMQELILEPYAGLVFGLSPGDSTQLSGAQNGGVFAGMVLVGLMATGLRIGSLRAWVAAGCLGSAAALCLLAAIGPMGAGAALFPTVVAVGFFNGMFAVAAIGAMMALAGEGRGAREGTRMGLWGAAQAIAAGFGGFLGAGLADLFRQATGDAEAFALVFQIEAALFLASAWLAFRIMGAARAPVPQLIPGE
jgi:BCD family chlorophyll transporter-like MFS transporter